MPKRSENYQTVRVQALEMVQENWHGRGRWDYVIVQRDMTKVGIESIVDVFVRTVDLNERGIANGRKFDNVWASTIPTEYQHWHTHGGLHKYFIANGFGRSRFHTKSDTVKFASNLAFDAGLPFHRTNDVVDYYDTIVGLHQGCMLCQERTGVRSHTPVVCSACKEAAAAGRAAQQPKIAVYVRRTFSEYLHKLYSHTTDEQGRGYAQVFKEFSELIAAASGSVESTTSKFSKVLGTGNSGLSAYNRDGDGVVVLMFPDQYVAWEKLISLLENQWEYCYRQGMTYGSQLLVAMAQGWITLDYLDGSIKAAKPIQSFLLQDLEKKAKVMDGTNR